MIRLTLLITCVLAATVTGVAQLVDVAADTFTLPATTASTAGVIVQNGSRFVHTYAGADTIGVNTFVGRESGNFTMGGIVPFQGSYNTGLGYRALWKNTTGFDNTAVGAGALSANTTGTVNTATGVDALFANTAGYYNAAMGGFALAGNTTGVVNTAVGVASDAGNTTGSGNTTVGAFAGYTETPGNRNVSGYNNVWIGVEAGPGTSEQLNNTVAVGYRSHPTASNQVVLGNDTITSTVLYGTISVGNKVGITAGGAGQTCTITEVTGGLITGATCS